MKNKILVFAGFLGFMFTAISFTSTANEAVLDDAVYQGPKNLQVLPKDINQDDLKVIMESFNEALGVKCGFCHVRAAEGQGMDFSSDEKMSKHIARSMMIMTSEINQKYFDMYPMDNKVKQISCMTCHNGKKDAFTYMRELSPEEKK
ncbi:MAG: c-type cytochrome [Chitinophagales bacterium]|nr:c-type cytochrome [Chitinophagales bacterium]